MYDDDEVGGYRMNGHSREEALDELLGPLSGTITLSTEELQGKEKHQLHQP